MKEREIISAAFNHIAQLELIYGDTAPSSEIKKGFVYDNEVISFISGANGIFKPKQLDKAAISIITTVTDSGGRNSYEDFEGDDGAYYYLFERPGKSDYRNDYLIYCYEKNLPFIYFKAVAKAKYQCIWPCYVDGVNEEKRLFKIIVGFRSEIIGAVSKEAFTKPKEIQTKYYVREAKYRGHQAEFREEVLKAYSRKCAISGLPEDRLLQAAHIIPDAEYSGTQTVCNGIALNYLHHKAYDSFLIGIDSDYTVHISESLQTLKGGPLLEYGILGFDNKKIRLPRNSEFRPNQDLLHRKFEKYKIKNLI